MEETSYQQSEGGQQHHQQQEQYIESQASQNDMHRQDIDEMYNQGDYGEHDQMVHDQSQQEHGNNNALNLKHVIGFNKNIDQGVHNLTTEDRTEIFYAAAHTGVIYNYKTKQDQKLLQGHCNQISATACSDKKQFIITADIGDDSMLVVWDSISGTPVRTYLNPHPNGVQAIDLSMDDRYIVTLGADSPQTISLWDWTNEKEEGPIVSQQYKYTEEFQHQHWVKFNPDNHYELASNGQQRVLFLNWEDGSNQFQFYSPRMDQKDLNQSNKTEVPLTKTVFIPGTEMAVTGNMQGQILVWDRSLIIEGIGEQNEKRLIKTVEFSRGAAINILLTVDSYLVCGNNNGTIQFYDKYFRIVAWFEDLNFTTIKSISFSKKPAEPATNEYTDPIIDQKDSSKKPEAPFSCPEFLVTDDSALVCLLKSSLFEEIVGQKKKGVTLMTGIKSSVSAIAVHPTEPILAIAGAEGFILLWNYVTKGDPFYHHYEQYTKDNREKVKENQKAQEKNAKGDKDKKKKDEKEKSKRFQIYTTMTFTPDGSELLIGDYKGSILVFDMEKRVLNKPQAAQKTSEGSKVSPIKDIVVSPDGQYLATSDHSPAVCLFKRGYGPGDASDKLQWLFSGKMKAHQVEITSIAFGESVDTTDELSLRLFSIGRDRRCFEYDVANSKYNDKLPVLKEFTIEQEAHPTACIWYPPIDSKEGLLLTANDEYKMKIWNPSNGCSRKTCLGPTYGGEIVKMKHLDIASRSQDEEKYLLYATKKKVIGLIKLPLDGNPNKTMGLIAHPDEIVDICASSDGKYLFTCGGDDLAVNMWEIDVTPVEMAIQMGGEGITPFINLIEGGEDGQTYQDMKDFFYYSMIRSKGEGTTKTRKLDKKEVPIEELPNLMRAMGYYPTQKEVTNMSNEVRFSELAEKGLTTNSVDLETFVKLFVNHRPVYGIGKNNIEEAFKALTEETKSQGDDDSNEGQIQINRDVLYRLLQEDGETIQVQELEKLLGLLIGETDIKVLQESLTADEFASDVLGFEEVDYNEDEEAEEEEI